MDKCWSLNSFVAVASVRSQTSSSSFHLSDNISPFYFGEMLSEISTHLDCTKDDRDHEHCFIWEEQKRWKVEKGWSRSWALSEGASYTGLTLYCLNRFTNRGFATCSAGWRVFSQQKLEQTLANIKALWKFMAASMTADESLKQFPPRVTDVKSEKKKVGVARCHSLLIKTKGQLKLQGKNQYHDNYHSLILFKPQVT